MKGRMDPEKDESSGFPTNVSKAELRAAQIAQLYSQVHVGMIAAVVAAFALAALLWNSVSRERILLWMTAFLVVQIPRHLLLRRFHRKQPHGAEVLPWGTWYLAGSGITALLFGSAALVMFPSDNLVDQCLLATFLGGFAASTAVAHAPLRECHVSSVLLTLLPLLGRFLYEGGESGFVLAAVGLVFAGALLGTGNALHRMIASSIRLRFQRDETIRKLRQAYEVLEDRVAERTADLANKNLELGKEISQRRETEGALRVERGRFEALAENLPLGLVSISDQGTFQYVNRKFRELFGYELEDIPDGRQWFRLAYPDPEYRRQVISSWKKDLGEAKPGEQRPREYVVACKDGSMKTVLFRPVQLAIGDHLMTCEDVTERKAAERGLADHVSMMEAILDKAADGICVCHNIEEFPYVRFTHWNPRMTEITGYSMDEINQSGWYQTVYPDDRIRQAAIDRMARMRLGDDIRAEEWVITSQDGTEKPLSISTSVIKEEDGVVHALAIIQDISDRKRAEQVLRESESKYRTLVESSPDGVFVQVGDRIEFANSAMARLMGTDSPEALRGVRVLDLVHPEFHEQIHVRMAQNFEQGKPVPLLEQKLVRLNGSVFDAEAVGAPLSYQGQNARQVLVRDITDRKRADAQIKLNEERLQSLYDIARYKAETIQDLLDFTLNEAVKLAESKVGYIYLYDEEKKLFELNTWSREVMKECEVAEPQTLYELDKTGIWGEAVRQRKPLVLNDFHAPNDLKKGYPEGHVSLHNFMTIPVFEGTKIVAVVGVANKDSDYDESDVLQLTLLMDSVWRIAAAKRSEIAQRRSATALEHAAEGVIITDTEGTIQYVNPSLERMTGYSQDELLENNPRILKSGEQDAAFYEQLWRTIKGGDIWTGRFVNKRKDGTFYTEEATISPVRDAIGMITGFVGMKRDITEHLSLSRQLLQAQKMEAIGTLAGGIAHDVNNLLQAVLGYSDLLLMKKGPGDPDTAKLKVIQQAARDGAELVSRILTFSRKGESKTRPLDLNEEILKTEKLLRRTLPRMIEIDLVLAPDIGIVDADPAQLEQVILNLGVNAHHAMPEGGRLLLETSNVSLSDAYLRTHLGAKPGRYVLLTVSDTGMGMGSTVLERIFEPFFTTKPSGLGTGLGLSMVHGIVTQHGGYIRCYSEPGRGTSFKIYFPVSQSDLAFDSNLTREMPAFGTETILLVDDDNRIREMGRQMIEMAGYKVLIARSGEEALEVHSSHKDEIALIILDLIMPGMGGSRCLEELLRRDPNVKVLVASGYSSNGLSQADKGSQARGFVSKPYDAKDILTAIRRVLDTGIF